MKSKKNTAKNANLGKKSLDLRASQLFALQSAYSPAGDQPQAIEKITHSFKQGAKYATLLHSNLRPKIIYEKCYNSALKNILQKIAKNLRKKC